MNSISISNIKDELGEWSISDNIDSLRVYEQKYPNYDISSATELTIFARPSGLQFSYNSFPQVLAIKYDDIAKISLPNISHQKQKKYSAVLSCLLFGSVFYIIGGILGGKNLGLFWLPCGLIVGLLLTLRFRKNMTFQELRLELKNSHTLIFDIPQVDRDKTIEFFSKYSPGIFQY